MNPRNGLPEKIAGRLGLPRDAIVQLANPPQKPGRAGPR